EDGARDAVLGVEREPLAPVHRPARRIEDGVLLALGAGEDALERHPHRTRQPHVVEHVLRADAAVHDGEGVDLDAVDARVKDPLRIAVEARPERTEVVRQALSPEVPRLDDVPVGVGEVIDHGPGLLLSAVTREPRPCQSSALIKRPTPLPLSWPPGLSKPGWVPHSRSPDATHIEKLTEVGRYALGVLWGDRHDSILPFRNLRRACPCETCTAAPEVDLPPEAERLARVEVLGALERRLPMTRFGVMKHLRVLEEAGLVVTKKRGREKLHFLNPVPIRLVHDRWVSKYAAPWAATLSGLEHRLEDKTMEKVFEIYIKTTPERLWEAITNPEMRRKYNFGAGVESDWTPGSRYQGVSPLAPAAIWEGENLEVDPPRRLVQSFRALWSEDVK